jgi:integrase
MCPARRAVCYTLTYTGMRISEALELGPHRLDLGTQAVCVRTLKRRRLAFRLIPVPELLISMLQALPAYESERYWPIHRTTAWRIIHDTMRDAEIVGPMATCKGLRHAFGIRAATCNIPGPLVQKFLGHASATTTAIYLDAIGVEEREFVRRMW